MVALTFDEVSRLFRVIKRPRDRALFLIAYRHALRVSEACQLVLSQIDWRNRLLSIQRLKGSMETHQPIAQDVFDALLHWRRVAQLPNKASQPLFPSCRGTPLTRQAAGQLMRFYARAAGLPRHKQHFHCLKHTCATHLLNGSGNISAVQSWLGHAQIGNTMLYAKLQTETRDKVVNDVWAKQPKL